MPTRPFSPHVARRSVVLACVVAFCAAPTHAANFSIGGSSSGAQTLGANQTGVVTSTGALTVAGSTVAVTVTGNNASLTNLGRIEQTGSGRVVRDNTGVTGLVIDNGSLGNASALMQTADADVIQMNKSAASVVLNNYGQLLSLNASSGGNQAVDFNAIASGANTINNYAGGLLRANEADAVRPGVNGVVNNWGSILSVTASGASSDGVDAQANSGIVISNAGLVQGGRHGVTGGQAAADAAFTMQITNLAGGLIQGSNGSGINLDGVNGLQRVSVDNAGSIVGNGINGDGDGLDVDGVVTVINRSGAVIRSVNSFGAVASGLAYSEALSVGGGQITNAGLIEGLVASGNTNAVGRGISLVGNDITSGAQAGKRESLYADAVVVNQAGGVIRGQSDSAVYAAGLTGSGRTVTVRNDAGALLRGGGATTAAIVVASDYGTTITNAGVIDGSSSGKAIALGSGRNTVVIDGGQARVLGDIDGGSGSANTLRIAAGAGNDFSYAGSLSGFASVRVESGQVLFSGISRYTGTTTLLGGATLTLAGADRLAAEGSLELAGGTLVLGGAQSFASLSLTASSVVDLGQAVLSFASVGGVAAGAQLAVSQAGKNGESGLRFTGDLLADAGFMRLVAVTTINGRPAAANFDGTFTRISAVPEPGMAWLLGCGLAALALRRRRPA